MHDVNPLGPMMHLKELDRQAVPKLRPLSGREAAPSLATLTAVAVSLLRRLHTIGRSRDKRVALLSRGIND
jgi:hypothetical protein